MLPSLRLRYTQCSSVALEQWPRYWVHDSLRVRWNKGILGLDMQNINTFSGAFGVRTLEASSEKAGKMQSFPRLCSLCLSSKPKAFYCAPMDNQAVRSFRLHSMASQHH